MNYLSLSTPEGTVYIAKEPILYIWVYNAADHKNEFDVMIVFRSGESLDLSFESEEARKIPVQTLLGFLADDKKAEYIKALNRECEDFMKSLKEGQF